MDLWVTFWGALLLLSLLIFSVLAVAVTFGGFKDVLSLFRSIEAQHAQQDEEK